MNDKIEHWLVRKFFGKQLAELPAWTQGLLREEWTEIPGLKVRLAFPPGRIAARLERA